MYHLYSLPPCLLFYDQAVFSTRSYYPWFTEALPDQIPDQSIQNCPKKRSPYPHCLPLLVETPLGRIGHKTRYTYSLSLISFPLHFKPLNTTNIYIHIPAQIVAQQGSDRHPTSVDLWCTRIELTAEGEAEVDQRQPLLVEALRHNRSSVRLWEMYLDWLIVRWQEGALGEAEVEEAFVVREFREYVLSLIPLFGSLITERFTHYPGCHRQDHSSSPFCRTRC